MASECVFSPERFLLCRVCSSRGCLRRSEDAVLQKAQSLETTATEPIQGQQSCNCRIAVRLTSCECALMYRKCASPIGTHYTLVLPVQCTTSHSPNLPTSVSVEHLLSPYRRIVRHSGAHVRTSHIAALTDDWLDYRLHQNSAVQPVKVSSLKVQQYHPAGNRQRTPYSSI